jgi:hypothetical protein
VAHSQVHLQLHVFVVAPHTATVPLPLLADWLVARIDGRVSTTLSTSHDPHLSV